MLRVLTCLSEEHDLRLVCLSACICFLGCFTTVTLLARTWIDTDRTRWRWEVAAALTFGGSVWSLHFVAMLAFLPNMLVAYDQGLTMLSAAVAIIGALAAFVLQSRIPPVRLRFVVAGLALGSGIAGMHYLGAAAMQVSGFKLFDPLFVAASIVISLGFGVIAMARVDSLSRLGRRLEVTAWFAITICGLHFTGMAALRLVPGNAALDDRYLIGSTTLAMAVAVVSILILFSSLCATLMQQHVSRRNYQELGRMRLLSNLYQEALLIQQSGLVVEMNDAAERMFRAGRGKVIGSPLVELFSGDDAPALIRQSRYGSQDVLPEEVKIVTAHGDRMPAEVTCQMIEYLGKPATAISLRDLTDRKRDEAHIRHLARHDALTNLPNRYKLEERLSSTLASAAEAGSEVAVLYLDLDRFKPVNDLLGHAAGDALLTQVAKRLLVEVRPADTVARLGGDEFVLVLADLSGPEKAALTAARISETLRSPFLIEGHRVEIGVSIGIALFPSDGANGEALLRAADTAMYRAKEKARGTVLFYEASMSEQLQELRRIELELRRALELDELKLAFQPMVNGRTGEIETFEALIRWEHPKRGLIPPAEFIPIAEQAEIIGKVGQWVIETACREAVAWPQPWRVSVNVSPAQFRQSDVPAIVAAALERYNLSPSRLVLEITEGVFIENTAKAVEVLVRLRRMGVRLALDDFGTGYSSLSYLQLFKFDKIKIDRSFIDKLDQSDDARTIVNAIVNLGHNLGLQVTAEGVETRQQLAALQALECDQLQGYLFGRPAPVRTVTELDCARIRAMFSGARARLTA